MVWSVDSLTLVLSIMAFSAFQLLLLVGNCHAKVEAARDEAMHKKLDELIKAIPAANNDLAGSEPQTEST